MVGAQVLFLGYVKELRGEKHVEMVCPDTTAFLYFFSTFFAVTGSYADQERDVVEETVVVPDRPIAELVEWYKAGKSYLRNYSETVVPTDNQAKPNQMRAKQTITLLIAKEDLSTFRVTDSIFAKGYHCKEEYMKFLEQFGANDMFEVWMKKDDLFLLSKSQKERGQIQINTKFEEVEKVVVNSSVRCESERLKERRAKVKRHRESEEVRARVKRCKLNPLSTKDCLTKIWPEEKKYPYPKNLKKRFRRFPSF